MKFHEPSVQSLIAAGCYLALVFLVACSSPGLAETREAASPREIARIRDNAYSLLFQLLEDQKNVSKLLIIKRDTPDLKDLVKDIAARSSEAAKQLENFNKADKSLRLRFVALPPGEIATRKAIEKTKTRELLQSSGNDFELALLLAQSEALNYGLHLSQVAATAETNTERANAMKALSRDMKAFHSRCLALISRKPHPR